MNTKLILLVVALTGQAVLSRSDSYESYEDLALSSPSSSEESSGEIPLGKLQPEIVKDLPPTEPNCKWTGCEGKTRWGANICKEYGAGRYTGNTSNKGCAWDASRVECCQPLPAGTVKWTKQCYGTAYGANYVCKSEYGPGFQGTGKKKTCTSGLAVTQYECKK